MQDVRLQGLYGISESGWYRRPHEAIELLLEAIEGGMKIFQLREKEGSDEEILPLARALWNHCRQKGVLFILNDRLDLALSLGVDGVHLGIDDAEASRARILLPHGIIGISCYGDLDRARRAKEEGASYVAFGSCFPSPTKPASSVIDLTLFKKAQEELAIPLCAIGGIEAQNAGELIHCDMIAVISSLWSGGVAQVRKNAKGLIQNWRENRERV